jgi:regulator of sigma E protease
VLTTVVALIVVLGVLVFIHEAGHFIAAKWAGIYVHRFSLGLGSPIRWLTFRRGETEYSVSWIPLGGYVKMASGEEDIGSSPLEGGRPADEVPRDRMFESKPLWKRMVVILAGVTMNALFAWFLFTFLAAKNGRQIDPTTRVGRVVSELVPPAAEALKTLRPGTSIVAINGRRVSSWNDIEQRIIDVGESTVRLELADGDSVEVPLHPDALEDRLKASQAIQPFRAAVIGQVIPSRPAARAGMAVGDTVVSVDGQPVQQWYDLLEVLRQDPGKVRTFVVARGTRHLSLSIRPDVETMTDPQGKVRPVGRIGVAVQTSFRSESLSLTEAVEEGWKSTASASTQIVRTIRGLFSGRISKREVGGPIMIGQLAGESARMGLDSFLAFMALISINLAILNLLPVPILDGGQFVFLLAEGITRRPLPVKLRERLSMVGMVLIVLLMGLAFSNDIRRLFGG